jgi:hypothetical protein
MALRRESGGGEWERGVVGIQGRGRAWRRSWKAMRQREWHLQREERESVRATLRARGGERERGFGFGIGLPSSRFPVVQFC